MIMSCIALQGDAPSDSPVASALQLRFRGSVWRCRILSEFVMHCVSDDSKVPRATNPRAEPRIGFTTHTGPHGRVQLKLCPTGISMIIEHNSATFFEQSCTASEHGAKMTFLDQSCTASEHGAKMTFLGQSCTVFEHGAKMTFLGQSCTAFEHGAKMTFCEHGVGAIFCWRTTMPIFYEHDGGCHTLHASQFSAPFAQLDCACKAVSRQLQLMAGLRPCM